LRYIRTLVATLAVCLGAAAPARADTLIAQASRSAGKGDFLRALVYADAAIAHPHVDAAALATFALARDSYGGRWVLQTLDQLGPITEGNAAAAFGKLRSIKPVLARDHIASPALDVALTQATNLLFARVHTLEAAGDLAQAEVLMAALVAAMGTHGEELTALRARAHAARLAQAPAERERADHAPTAMLHLQAAARYGEVAPAALQAAIGKTRPLTEIVVGGSASGTCFAEAHELDRAASAAAGVAVHVDIQLSGCDTSGPEVTTGTASLPYTHTSTQLVARQHIENKGYECHTVATDQGATTYTSSYERPGCAMPLFVVVDDAPERRELEVTEHDDVATVDTRYRARASARVVVSWPGGSLAQDVSGAGVSFSRTYGAFAHGQRPAPWTPASAADAHRAALKELATNAYAATAGVRARLAAAAIARAEAAADPLLAEDDLVVAALIEGAASPALVALGERRYHMTAAELQAALFGTALALPGLGEAIVAPSVTDAEVVEDERVYRAVFLQTATGRSAYAVSFDVGYARSTGDARAEHGAFLFAFNYFLSFPDGGRFALSTLADIRYGRGGLLDGRLGFGGGVNLSGVLVHPFVGLGFDRLGLTDPTTVRYGTAAVVEAGLRVGLAIPRVLATDATFARRRRLDVGGDPIVENRLDVELRVQPYILGLQYTQLSTAAADLWAGPTLAHQAAQLVEVLVGYGF
jgi:hypothetical protein